jgi:hypothetical protein
MHIISHVCFWAAEGCVIVLEIPTIEFHLGERWSPETIEMGYFRAEAGGIS